MESLIELKDLTKTFGDIKAVNKVSLSVKRGEVLGFLGPNGAGKSTTMKMATGFLLPDNGTATLMGADVTEDPIRARSKMGYLPEGAPAYGDMTPRSYLAFIGEARGIKGKELDAAIDRVATKTHIKAVLDQMIDTLSKGFKRRVGLAQALIHNPDILILDEPTDGLDPNQKFEVRKLIQEMAKDKAIIISTHILEEVDAICTRAVIISQGKIIADDTPERLRARSSNHNVLTISVKPEAATVARTTMMKFDTVKKIEKQDETDAQVVFRIQPKDGYDLLEQTSTILRERDWKAGDIKVEHGQLDDVFRELTSSKLS